MSAGRKPTPSHLKIINGNPGKRPINEDEPKPPKPKRIKVPGFLPPEAKKEYRRAAKQLQEIGVLTEVDLKALEIYAEQYAIWKAATEKVHDVGMIIRAPGGLPIQSPYLSIANQAAKRMQSLMAEFGMTPSSRTRVVATPSTDDDFGDV